MLPKFTKEVKLSPAEEKVLSIIFDKGEYLWQQGQPEYVPKEVLKELMWKDWIERKPTYVNVFTAKFWGTEIIRFNRTAKKLKETWKAKK